MGTRPPFQVIQGAKNWPGSQFYYSTSQTAHLKLSYPATPVSSLKKTNPYFPE